MAGKRKTASAKRATPTPQAATIAASGGINRERIAAVLAHASEMSVEKTGSLLASESGLTSGKGGRISGRVSPELIERAKTRTGLRSDTELVAYALANIAVEDDFARAFRELRGTVPADLDLDV